MRRITRETLEKAQGTADQRIALGSLCPPWNTQPCLTRDKALLSAHSANHPSIQWLSRAHWLSLATPVSAAIRVWGLSQISWRTSRVSPDGGQQRPSYLPDGTVEAVGVTVHVVLISWPGQAAGGTA
jgi:hypothetical protein